MRTTVELRSDTPVGESADVAGEVVWQVCTAGQRHHLRITRLTLETNKILITMDMPEGVEGLTPERHGQTVAPVLIEAVRIGVEKGLARASAVVIEVAKVTGGGSDG